MRGGKHMKLYVLRISIDRRTGETLGQTNIGSTDAEASEVAKASITLLTGMALDEACQATIGEEVT